MRNDGFTHRRASFSGRHRSARQHIGCGGGEAYVYRAAGKQGRAAGHICLEEGQGELCWRGRCQGKAVLLSGEGERWLTEQGRCPFVPVGALVLEGETLLAWGNAPGASLTEQELLALYKEKTFLKNGGTTGKDGETGRSSE